MKDLEEYERIFAQNTEYFSTCNPDLIEDTLVKYLKDKKVEAKNIKVNPSKYKIKFSLNQYGLDDE